MSYYHHYLSGKVLCHACFYFLFSSNKWWSSPKLSLTYYRQGSQLKESFQCSISEWPVIWHYAHGTHLVPQSDIWGPTRLGLVTQPCSHQSLVLALTQGHWVLSLPRDTEKKSVRSFPSLRQTMSFPLLRTFLWFPSAFMVYKARGKLAWPESNHSPCLLLSGCLGLPQFP